MFQPVDPRVNFPEVESSISAFWAEHDIFRRSIDERPDDRLFVWFEGPPTANARPGIHHVLSRVFKDVIPRFRTMQGYKVPRRAGWDTHGLPVELEIEKELGLTSKPEIEAFGIADFNERCKQSVSRYMEEWTELSKRIGFWSDLEHPYVTYHNSYIETCWWLFSKLWDAGLIYRDYRSTPHCPRCGTSLSSHEVSQGYEDNTPDPSVFVKFAVPDEALFAMGHPRNRPLGGRARLVAWTTTPWTLPGNTALAVKADAEYGMYLHEDEFLVMATALAPKVLGEEARPMLTLPGAGLVGLTYEPLYRAEDAGAEVMRFDDGRLRRLRADEHTEGLRRVIAADYVSLDDGTGIVHIAPSYGSEDFTEGRRNDLLFVQNVDLRGIMAEGLPGAGKFVKQADADVIRDLTERGLMLRAGTIRHTYPFCWRCRTPLLYYAKPSWYIRTTGEKDALVAGNQEINWYPEHIKDGRFGNWLDNNIDWAVSRERYWGTPLPFWECELCGESTCIGSQAELERRAREPEQVAQMDDLHRPYIDAITIGCDNCGGTMRRVPEVADAWFDSGAMPYAQWHYPFANNAEFNQMFPADFICEAIDQTRGWFYTLHAEATLMHAAAPEEIPSGIAYRNVICLGHIQDEQGNKMSKSRGNAVEPWSVINQTGADAVRWYMFTASPAGASRRFSARLVEEALRGFLLTLWNTYSFFVSYANIDGIDPREEPVELTELDRWILSELNVLIGRVTDELEAYDPTDAGRAIEAFVDDLSNWYVRRSRRRFWRGAGAGDADKQAAYFTLYTCLKTVTQLAAPFVPFVSEKIWQNLVRSIDTGAPESVHLAEWPLADAARIDERLNAETQLLKRVASMGRAARARAQIKVRQPVAEVAVRPRAAEEGEVLRRNESLILEELNAKSLRVIGEGEADIVTYDLKPNLPVLGPKYGRAIGAIRGGLAQLDPARVAEAVRRNEAVQVGDYTLEPGEILLDVLDAEGYAAAVEAGYTVAVATAITPELADEGLARELVRRIQDMRRAADFNLSDRITTWYAGGDDIARVVASFGAYIGAETLSTELVAGAAPADAHAEEHTIDGASVTLAVRRNA